MTVYGPATGNYSSKSILLARKANKASAGDQIINGKFVDNTGGTNNYTNGSKASKKQAQTDSGSSSMVKDIQRAYEAKEAALQAGLKTQLADIKQSSDENRSDVYTNSRLSAIGNNERLASQGLAGNLYTDPSSGQSETSRIAQNVALGNDINAANRQQISLENAAKQAVLTSSADNQLAMAQTIAQLKQQEREEAKADLATTKAEYAQNVGQFYGDFQAEINKVASDGDSSNDWQLGYLGTARQSKIQSQNAAEAEAEQQAFENQLKALETEYKINKPYYNPNTGKSSRGGGSGGSSRKSSSSSKPTLTAAQAKEALTAGSDKKRVINDTTVAAYNYYYGTNYQAIGGQLVNERRADAFGQLDFLAQASPNQQAFKEHVNNFIKAGRISKSDYEAWLKTK